MTKKGERKRITKKGKPRPPLGDSRDDNALAGSDGHTPLAAMAETAPAPAETAPAPAATAKGKGKQGKAKGKPKAKAKCKARAKAEAKVEGVDVGKQLDIGPPFTLHHRWKPAEQAQCYLAGTVAGQPKKTSPMLTSG